MLHDHVRDLITAAINSALIGCYHDRTSEQGDFRWRFPWFRFAPMICNRLEPESSSSAWRPIIGVCTTLFLAEQGVPVVLCEKGIIAGEQSSRNLRLVSQNGPRPAQSCR